MAFEDSILASQLSSHVADKDMLLAHDLVVAIENVLHIWLLSYTLTVNIESERKSGIQFDDYMIVRHIVHVANFWELGCTEQVSSSEPWCWLHKEAMLMPLVSSCYKHVGCILHDTGFMNNPIVLVTMTSIIPVVLRLEKFFIFCPIMCLFLVPMQVFIIRYLHFVAET